MCQLGTDGRAAEQERQRRLGFRIFHATIDPVSQFVCGVKYLGAEKERFYISTSPETRRVNCTKLNGDDAINSFDGPAPDASGRLECV